MSEVETLRTAAVRMRALADAATPGPWEVGDWWHVQGASQCLCNAGPLAWEGERDINGKTMQAHIHRVASPYDGNIMQADPSSGYPVHITMGNDWGDGVEPHDAEFIAAADPLFMRAVADWLDIFANYAETGENARDETDVALAVARTFLGEADE